MSAPMTNDSGQKTYDVMNCSNIHTYVNKAGNVSWRVMVTVNNGAVVILMTRTRRLLLILILHASFKFFRHYAMYQYQTAGFSSATFDDSDNSFIMAKSRCSAITYII